MPREEMMTDAVTEVEEDRAWRQCCGEPAPGHYPVRCRRLLGHPDGHLGIGSRIASQLGEELRYESTYVTWPGVGNALSAQRDKFRCWCTLKNEPLVPSWAIREYPRRSEGSRHA